MSKFQNREEYEKWKTNREKELQFKTEDAKKTETYIKEIYGIQSDKKIQNTDIKLSIIRKLWNVKRYRVACIFFTAIIIYLSYQYLYVASYKPKRIATEYLKAIRLHDYKKLFELSSLIDSPVKDSILINLLDWTFIDEQKISIATEKVQLDLSEDDYGKDKEYWLKTMKEDSVDKLPDVLNYLKNYYSWRDHKIETYKAFEELGNYYYNRDIHYEKVKYLLDITATNKLGMELKNKYFLVVARDRDSWDKEWKVIQFFER